MRRLFIATALLCSLAVHAQSGEIRVFGSRDAVDPGEVARILERRAPVKMRSIKLLDDGPRDAPAKASADAAPDDGPTALSLPVQFAFDSAELLPAARPQLDALAEGIRMLPTAQAVVIEGHTDVLGSDAYNLRLSQRRAMAVRSYLVAQGIDAGRLRAVGYGEQRTLPGRDGAAPENRRVQFRGE
jgi:outer membrane protein OmpA-like peptidoglycan-associated protein